MTLRTEKKLVYLGISFCTAAAGQTWVQIAYNDPSSVKDWGGVEWVLIPSITMLLVLGQVFTTWKAFLSDPNQQEPKDKNEK